MTGEVTAALHRESRHYKKKCERGRKESTMKKRIISSIVLIGCIIMATIIGVQAGDTEQMSKSELMSTHSEKKAVKNENQYVIEEDAETIVLFDNGVFEYAEKFL